MIYKMKNLILISYGGFLWPDYYVQYTQSPGSLSLSPNGATVTGHDNFVARDKRRAVHGRPPVASIHSSTVFNSLVTLAIASCAAALTLSTPSHPTAGVPTQLVWSSSSNDASVFTLFLLDNGNLPFGLEQDFGELQTADGEATITFDDGFSEEKTYILAAVNSSNVDMHYASTAAFTFT
uniref:Uncharacterized protein n=2 Tax=Moniliophthora roreri TaxID=221103 RepID=A0A0W0FWN7_MONRR